MGSAACSISYDQVDEAFLKAPPLITSTIKDKSITHPNFYADMPSYQEFPLGNGTTMTEIITRGRLPEYEVGLGKWRKMEGDAGCSDCAGPDCSYNTTVLGGNSFETRIMQMMERDFRSEPYCIKQIQTTYQYEIVFEGLVKNLYRQIDFYKEFNISMNILNMLSKKYVLDSGGFKVNVADPYSFPNTGTAVLSTLNIYMLTRFYQWLRRLPDVEPYDIINGRPIYALSCSDELIADMFRDDPLLRTDTHFSEYADALLTKYNFQYTIRDMFIFVPTEYPFRYSITAGVVSQISPFVNGVPAEVGSYSANNPTYELTGFEGVMVHGKNPFTLFYMPTASSLGENTSFGPEFSWFDNWMWINPLEKSDPFRRSGFFVTSATLGIGQQYSEGIFQILVPRTNLTALWTQGRQPVCYVAPPDCSANQIPATGCPCPQLVEFPIANPMVAGRYYLHFAVPVTGSPGGTLNILLTNGGKLAGTIVTVSADGYYVDVNFGSTFVASNCAMFQSIDCVDVSVCSANVLSGGDCRADEIGAIKLILEAPLRAVATNVVTAFFCDGTSVNMTIATVDVVNSTYTFSYIAGTSGPTDNPTGLILGNLAGFFPNMADLCCDRGLPTRICVPTATTASCPGCAVGPVVTQCS